jgi:3-oxoadipate enol-lactonase
MTQLHFLDPNPAGDQVVLLLHGLGAGGSSWVMQLPPLIEAGFRPIAPDVTGFGDSPYDGRGWNIQRAAEDVGDLLDELEVSRAHLVGISMGGTIALQLALDQPQHVHKLVLASTFATLRPDKLGVWIYFLRRLILIHLIGLKSQARLVAERIFPAPEQESLRQTLVDQITRADPRAYRAAMRSLGSFDVRDRLWELKIPTLVVTGEHDTTVPPASQRVLVDRIAGARQAFIPGAGHALSVDHPREFNQALLTFLLS